METRRLLLLPSLLLVGIPVASCIATPETTAKGSSAQGCAEFHAGQVLDANVKVDARVRTFVQASADLGGAASALKGAVKTACDGNCSAQAFCEGHVDAEANCEGSCEAECSGHCAGSCTDESGHKTDNDANCHGKCKAHCSGKCNGRCQVDVAAGVQCGSNVSCKGGCMSHFTEPKCETEGTPPKSTIDQSCFESLRANAARKPICRPPTRKL